MRNAFLGGLVAAAMSFPAAQADAAKIITQTYSFTVSDFAKATGTGPDTAPISSYSGSFTISFNPNKDYTNSTDISNPSISIAGISTFSFTYSGSGNGFLYFGGGSSAKAQNGTTDFELVVYDPTDGGTLSGTAYLYSGANTLYYANTVTIKTGVPVAAPVPEPATWAMMIGGLGLVGTALRRRATRTSVRFA